MKVPIEVSARHIHLCQKDLEKLFGKDYELTPQHELSQPGQYAAEETVDIIHNEHEIHHVRILGPVRNETQIELAISDTYVLKIELPVRCSGDLKNTPGLKIRGPNGEVKISHGAIIAHRHLHASPEEAEKLGLQNGQFIRVRVEGKRAVVFENVRVRVGKNYKLDMHVDNDEGNAAGIFHRTEGEILE